jgi:MoxR-like ATPase
MATVTDSKTHAQINELTEEAKIRSEPFQRLLDEVGRVIVGQKKLMHRMLIGLLGNGHLLIEGVPGLAKTTAVATLAKGISTGFQRLQFTPDLLPADLLGTLIYRPQDQKFVVQKGPIFSNLILADEINRAPAKVQSALLESMQERQVTIGDTTYPLPTPFLVLATQNPIEQEGTYPLPEAQVDRFLLKLRVDYPASDEERLILDRMTGSDVPEVRAVVSLEDIERARTAMHAIYVDDRIKDYAVRLVQATRRPKEFNLDLEGLVQYGASPRATMALVIAGRAHAFLRGRGFVSPEDIKAVGHDVMRHRLILSFEAEAESVTADEVVQRVFDAVEVP